MEKISSIVPASARVQSVDLNSSHPIRPGQPTFGRPVGVSSLAEGTRAEELARAEAEKIRDQERLVQAIQQNFFQSQVQPTAPNEVKSADPELDQPQFGRYLDVHV